MKALEIPEDVVDEVVAALSRAVGIAIRFDKSQAVGLSDTAVRLDEAIAYVEAAADRSRKWQPIETAPKDGTRFIACVEGTDDVAICSRHDPGGAARNPRHHYECWLVAFSKEHRPTHWQPLPDPPRALAQQP